jgi:nucleotidyltransferase substrate binding protein (TIGR01987 family)
MSYLIEGIDVSPFIKACHIFEDYRKNMKTDQEKAGAIQAFGFSYEMAWKTMKRLLNSKGIQALSPGDCFREATLLGIISDSKKWFGFMEKRNLTVHTYEAKVVIEIIAIFEDYSSALCELIGYIENEKNKSPLSS